MRRSGPEPGPAVVTEGQSGRGGSAACCVPRRRGGAALPVAPDPPSGQATHSFTVPQSGRGERCLLRPPAPGRRRPASGPGPPFGSGQPLVHGLSGEGGKDV